MNSNLLNSYNKYVIANYKKFPVCLVRGEGSRVWDDEGNAYLDLFPGWGCGLLGHCPPLIVEAVKNQIGKLIHVPNSWYTEPQGMLAEALATRTGWGQCFSAIAERKRMKPQLKWQDFMAGPANIKSSLR